MATPTTKFTARPTRPADAWAPIRRALLEGSAAPAIVVTDPAEADAVAVALRRACERRPWLLAVAAADTHRLLRAAGITLLGPGRRRFDDRRAAQGWGERPAEFESAAAAPRAGTQPVETALAPAGVVASSLNYVTRPDRTSWGLGSAVGRIEALTTSVLTPARSAARGDAYTFEVWWFVFVRCDLVIDAIDEPAGRGDRYRVTATSYARWSPDDDWSRTDEFSGVLTHCDGSTDLELDDGSDAGRELLLDAAIAASVA